ncbi:MAG: DUF1249 domain-containing protein [Pseudomonadota bacterium]
MELYEANYIQFRRLCPGLEHISRTSCSRVEGVLDLHLRLIERCKYTTTLCLTYHFQDGLEHIKPEPNLKVRIYHDARQAEVLNRFVRRSGIEVNTRDLSRRKSELSVRWSLNRFLYKWLGYCCHQGHRLAQQQVETQWPHAGKDKPLTLRNELGG